MDFDAPELSCNAGDQAYNEYTLREAGIDLLQSHKDPRFFLFLHIMPGYKYTFKSCWKPLEGWLDQLEYLRLNNPQIKGLNLCTDPGSWQCVLAMKSQK